MKGLIIDEPWLGFILSGQKTWEMRKTAVHHRGPIALIRKGSGQVIGTATLVGCLPPINDVDEYRRTEDRHRIPPSRQAAAFEDGWRTPWILGDAKPLPSPVPYTHPSGAVIWVNLEETVRRAIEAQVNGQGDQNEPSLERLHGEPRLDTEPGVDPVAGAQTGMLRAGDRKLFYVVQRGKAKGTILYPHVHADGRYVVSPSRFEKDYIRVQSLGEVIEYLHRGYSLRMSNETEPNHRSPSLIAPASISGWR